uniref:EF-hand domain-containing protein n=1 Tax=Globisporangium ultimum (strain ATCC 200006 / CBS 805.95 / DAOM BR144) TaxID=431595 RepID=K3WWZ6_GLOUD
MSIQRSQMLLMRPQIVKLSVRNSAASSGKKMHTQALALRLPSRSMAAGNKTTNIAITGAALAAGVIALANEAALSQEALFNIIDGKSGSGNGGNGKKDNEYVDWIIDQVAGRIGDITLGGGLGFCSGYALKQVGKVAAITIGGLFLLAQIASSKGYININWKKVEKDVITAVDPDGDGKITKNDFKIWLNQLLSMLKHNLPSSAGFTGGFVLGLSCS